MFNLNFMKELIVMFCILWSSNFIHLLLKYFYLIIIITYYIIFINLQNKMEESLYEKIS